MTGKNILVIGSGVSGLTSALLLLRAGHKVNIWSKESAGEFPSTSYNAYAMWVPVKIDADPRVDLWTNESYSAFEKLSNDAATGVEMRKIIALKPEHSEPWYATSLSIFRHATTEELPAGYADGHVLESAPVIDPTVYLPWLHNQVQTLGGKFEQREVEDIAKCPTDFEAIINCSGLGARQLAADTGLFPERMQVVRIKPNGFTDVVIDDEGHNKRSCIVPHRDYIQIGAVFDGNNETLQIDDKHTQDILERCRRMLPGFKCDDSDVISVARALRPERSRTRVELEKLADGRALVHNYGHDGMGYLISYGIAAEIAKYFEAL